MHKILWIDTETTGTNPQFHEIIQIAGVLEASGKPVATFDFRGRPTRPGVVDLDAMKAQGRTVEEIMTWPEHEEMYKHFLNFLNQHVDKYNKADKIIIAGHNVKFDLDMIFALFDQYGNPYLCSYLVYGRLDTLVMATILYYQDKIDICDGNGKPNFRLETLCNYFKCEQTQAHDALNDVMATREIGKKMFEMLGQESEDGRNRQAGDTDLDKESEK